MADAVDFDAEYRFFDGKTRLNAEELTRRFLSLHMRTVALEQRGLTFDALVAEGIGVALQRITEGINPLVLDAQTKLEIIRAALEEIESTGVPADQVTETLTRVFVSRTQRDNIDTAAQQADLDALSTGLSAGITAAQTAANNAQTAADTGGKLTRVNRTGNTQLVAADRGKLIDITGTGNISQTFDTPANLKAGWWVILRNGTSGFIQIGNNVSDGVVSFWRMYPGEERRFSSDGSTMVSELLKGGSMIFTSSDTFYWGPHIKWCLADLIGGGQGGTQGSYSAAGTGGSGGSGGGRWFGAVPVQTAGVGSTITVGSGGTGSTGGDGTAGGSGGNTGFLNHFAYGGFTTSTPGGAMGGGTSGALDAGGLGGAGSTGAGAGSAGGTSKLAGAGGGGGGPGQSANSGAGGTSGVNGTGPPGVAPTTTTPNSGVSGIVQPNGMGGGGSGGGGTSAVSTRGGRGGNGAAPGGGGGGGGGVQTNGGFGGYGGDGGRGEVRIYYG
ncbi:hypothetical protein [Methylobacterium nigriterrae]|uniref:hypothetical protein n=1 Tax=Methylobacterium nigriterrae TaxID=3127512 RepID=UPI0030135655